MKLSLLQGAEEGEGDEEILPQDQRGLQHVRELPFYIAMIVLNLMASETRKKH